MSIVITTMKAIYKLIVKKQMFIRPNDLGVKLFNVNLKITHQTDHE